MLKFFLELLCITTLVGCSTLNTVKAASVAGDWFKLNAMSIEIIAPDSSVTKFEFEIAKNSDVKIRQSTNKNGKKTNGELMLISNVLLSKDIPTSPGYEIDAIDVPSLTLQLVNQLLAFGTGKKPLDISGRLPVDVIGQTTPIRVGTISAGGEYPGPWDLNGYVESISPTEISYDLSHTFPGGNGKSNKIRYIGRWEQRPTPPDFPDSFPITGWKVFHLGPTQNSDGKKTVLDYGATKPDSTYKTLGELRSSVKSIKN